MVKNFKIIAEIDEINNLDYSLLDNIKKSTGLLDITSYFNESDENFDNEWVINDDDELKEKYPDLFNYRGTNLLIWKKTEELKKVLDNTQKIWIYKYYDKDEELNLYNIILKEEVCVDPFSDKKEEEAVQLSQYYEAFLYEKLNKDLIQLNLDKLIPQNFNSLSSNPSEKSSIWEDLFNKSWTKIKNYQDKN